MTFFSLSPRLGYPAAETVSDYTVILPPTPPPYPVLRLGPGTTMKSLTVQLVAHCPSNHMLWP